ARPVAQRTGQARPGTLCLEFLIGALAYAVDAAYVLEVFAPGEITPVPGVPEFVSGVAPWQGEILPVVDLTTVCGLAHSAWPPGPGRTTVAVVGRGEAACGLIVSSVTGAGPVSFDDLPRIEDGADHFLLGLAPGGVIVIDLERLLSSERLVVSENEPPLPAI
ncbi:MAG: chemotaxis protein CheW, partial [Desulfovibrionaceae bacterium]|nr:chemotaxis protein CheW [Desulfovibrionaceae bacterium]